MRKISLSKKVWAILTIAAFLLTPFAGVPLTYAAGLYSITGSGSVSGATVDLTGTSHANPQTGANNTQHMAVDWDEDQDNDPNTGTGWEEAPDGGLVFDPVFFGGNPQNAVGFDDSDWDASHTYTSSGTYNITVVVYHGQPTGQDGDDFSTFTFEAEVIVDADPAGTVTFLKQTDDVGGDIVEFDFTGDLGVFTLLGDNSDSELFTDIPIGDYTVAESTETGWTYDSVACDSGSWNDTGSGVVINLADGDDITCTFSNTQDALIPTTTIVAEKVVCEDESLLPNGIDNVDADTASDWVAQNEGCELVEDWEFEYKTEGDQSNPGGDLYGPAGGDWNTFSGQVEIETDNLSLIQMREVLQDGYIPFSDDNQDDYTAEFYCTDDAAGYDNWEWIQNPEADSTYYCVGFNTPEPAITINAVKIMCDSEEYLPNWGAGEVATSIDEDTAQNWLAEGDNSEHCEIVDWDFQWAEGTGSTPINPGDNTGEVGSPWAIFTNSFSVPLIGAESDRIWIREVWNDTLIPFTGLNTVQNVSAELYCDADVLNYDNYDFILNPEIGEEYNCVAWNAPVEPVDQCEVDAENTFFSDEETQVDGGDSVVITPHPSWVSIAGADWIWNEEVDGTGSHPVGTKIFTKTFEVIGTPLGGNLQISADNGYSVDVNGDFLCADADAENWSSVDVCPVNATLLQNGVNTITFTVENYERPDGYTGPNPGGLIYSLTVNENECELPEPEDATVTMCKTDGSQNPLSGWTLTLTGSHIEDLEVPAGDSAGVDTTNVLNAGISYMAKAFGTWLNDRTPNPLNHVDAEYSTEDGWLTQMDGFGVNTDILELRINDMFDPNSDWGTYNSTHTYAQSFVLGSDDTANFRIYDSFYADNSGSLDVEVYEGYAGITDETGCVVFEDVPFGTYEAGEIMQDGWVNVSGLGEVVIEEEVEILPTIVNRLDEGDQCVPGEEYGDSVTSYTPGTQKDGGAIPGDRNDPTKALGAPEDDDTMNFVSLGFGGEIVIEMEHSIQDGLGNDFRVYETSFGSPDFGDYPEEAEVFVSDDGVTFVSLGITQQGVNEEFDLLGSGLTQATHVKLVDVSDIDADEFNGDTDGYDLDGIQLLNCDYVPQEPEEPLACEAGVNLLANGSFEDPEVDNDAGWDIFDSGSTGLAWLVEWLNPVGAPDPAHLELHRGVSIVALNPSEASDGEQYAELDSDWGGPESAINGESASVAIWQDVETIPGENYRLMFDFSPRQRTNESENMLGIWWGGSLEDTISADGSTFNNTSWETHSYDFVAGESTTEVGFSDEGNSNTIGTFIDNVSLECIPEDSNGPDEFLLSIEFTGEGGGNITDGGDLDCDDEDEESCEMVYPEGTVVTLTVTPDEGSNFSNSWTDGFGDCSGNNTPCTITMTQDVNLTAHFDLDDQNGTGGTTGGNVINTTSGGSSGQVLSFTTSSNDDEDDDEEVLGESVVINTPLLPNTGSGEANNAFGSIVMLGVLASGLLVALREKVINRL